MLTSLDSKAADLSKAAATNEQHIKAELAAKVKAQQVYEQTEKDRTQQAKNAEHYKGLYEKCSAELEEVRKQLGQIKSNYNTNQDKSSAMISDLATQKESLLTQYAGIQQQLNEAIEEKQKYLLLSKESKGELQIAQLKLEQLRKTNEEMEERNRRLVKTIHTSLFDKKKDITKNQHSTLGQTGQWQEQVSFQDTKDKFMMTTPNKSTSNSKKPMEPKKGMNDSDDLTVFDSANKPMLTPTEQKASRNSNKKPSLTTTPQQKKPQSSPIQNELHCGLADEDVCYMISKGAQ